MKTYIGIDVSKLTLDVSTPEKSLQFENTVAGFRKLLRELMKFAEAHCVCESTGGYEKPLAIFLVEKSIAVSVENPFKVKSFLRSISGAKTDKTDAIGLRIYGERMNPQEWEAPRAQDMELLELWRRREDLVRMLVQEKNRLEVTTEKFVLKGIKHHIKHLEKMICEVEERVEELVKSDDKKSRIYSAIIEIKGCGKTVATALAITMPELGQLTRSTVAALAGVAPYNRDSGQHFGRRYIHGGRQNVRNSLYMPTLSAMRHNDTIRSFAERLKSKGKPFKVILIACMRKLLIHINAKLKTA